MEVKQFITKTLVELTEGLQEAGQSLGNQHRFKLVNTGLWSKGHGNYGLVEFDLAVAAAETKGKGGEATVGISVLKVNAGAKNEAANTSTSRIKFVVQDKGSV